MSPGGLRQSAVGNVLRLFEDGTVAGMTEGQLLDRFVGRADGAAFEALVDRHGPMVLGVCRRVLVDPNDVDDAFQATFLVLAKKAATIRDQQLLAHWLYGVAHRISVRARADATRRRTRERTGAWTDDACLTADSLDELAKRDLAALVQDEIARLPEKYRMPVVLCDLTGHTHEEAARRLACPVGTVKGRQARARDLLKKRLTQRGFAPSASLLILTMTQKSTAGVVPSSLVQTTIKAATLVATGQAAALGLISANAVVLMQGAMTTMTLSTLKLTAATALAASFVVGGAAVFAQGQGAIQGGEAIKTTAGEGLIGSGEQPSPVIGANVIATTDTPQPSPSSVGNPLLKQIRKAFEATRASHAEGKASNDRVYQTSMRLLNTEGATDPKAVEDHLGRMKQLQAQEVDLNAKGKSNPANVDMAVSYVMEAKAKLAEVQAKPEIELASNALPSVEEPTPRIEKSLSDQLIEQAKKSLESTRAFYDEGRITIDRLIEASAILMRAEGEDRTKSITRHVNFLKDVQKREEAELEIGRGTIANVNEVKTAVLEAQVRLAQANSKEASTSAVGAPDLSIVGSLSTPKVATPTTKSYEQRRLDQAEKIYVNAVAGAKRFLASPAGTMSSAEYMRNGKLSGIETASNQICKAKLRLNQSEAEIPKILAEHVERMQSLTLLDQLGAAEFAETEKFVERAELQVFQWLNQGKHPFSSNSDQVGTRSKSQPRSRADSEDIAPQPQVEPGRRLSLPSPDEDSRIQPPLASQPRSSVDSEDIEPQPQFERRRDLSLPSPDSAPPHFERKQPRPSPSSSPNRSPFNVAPQPQPSVELGFVPATNPSPSSDMPPMPGRASLPPMPPHDDFVPVPPRGPDGIPLGETFPPSPNIQLSPISEDGPGRVGQDSENPLTQATLKTLGKSITMSMGQETPLKDVIKFLKSATVDKENKDGLSVYFDPVALKEAHVTIDSPVTIDLPNIPIRTALKLVLSQLDLTYFVKDGVIFVTTKAGLEKMRNLFHEPEVLPAGPSPELGRP